MALLFFNINWILIEKSEVFSKIGFQFLFKVFFSPFQSVDNLAFQRAPGYWKGYAPHYAHNPLLSNPFSGSLSWVCAEYAHINDI